MRRIIKTSILLLLLTGFAASLQAQQRGNKGLYKKEWTQGQKGEGRIFQMLNLSDEQKEQIKEIRLNGQKEALPIRNAIGEKQARLRTLRTADNYDADAVESVIEEISDLRNAQMLMRERHRQQVRELLTEDQRVIFDSAPRKRHGMKANKGRSGRMGNKRSW